MAHMQRVLSCRETKSSDTPFNGAVIKYESSNIGIIIIIIALARMQKQHR